MEGVEKVEESDGKYAFFMESASIQYLTERRCKLSQVCCVILSLRNHTMLITYRLEAFLTAKAMA